MVVFIGRRVPSLIAALIALTLAMSIVAALDAGRGGGLYLRLALLPRAIWDGELWRLVTWPFVQGGPLSLIFACVAIYTFGWDLLSTWGLARFARFGAGVVAVAGVGTSLIALVLPMAWWLPHLGGMVIGDALVIAWALQFPERPVRIYWVLVLNGRVLASGIVAVTVLYAVFYGVSPMLPELLACGTALLYMNRPHRRWWLKIKAYRARRELGVIRGERHGGPYQPN